jgi:hypothetical protein
MAAKVRLNNFRFSIYIDADGTVTLTDLPPELREVAAALDPAHPWGTSSPISPPQEAAPSAEGSASRQTRPGGLGGETTLADSCRRIM